MFNLQIDYKFRNTYQDFNTSLMLLLMFNSVNIISLILLVFANWGMYHIDIVCFDQDRYLYMYVLYKYCSAVCFA